MVPVEWTGSASWPSRLPSIVIRIIRYINERNSSF